MKRTLTTLAVTAAMFGAAGIASAQSTQQPMQQSTQQQMGPKADIPANLAAKAKISESAARATALAKVPNSVVQAAELENENGKLLYSYDLKVAGQSGIQEVQVNAMDGSVIGVEHESPAAVAKEAAADRKAAMHAHKGKWNKQAKEGNEGKEKNEGTKKP
ncbi:MAG: PepSY domain-containing protein [Gemmatimonadaceae bacterium]